jgi:molybdenum cofactor cytidylyltransferase
MRIAGLVLAAGRSSRMAPRNKLLEPVGGEKMVRRVAATAIAGGVTPVIVVTGHEAQAVTAALSGAVTIVANPDYADGLSTSLRAGLGGLPAAIDGALILLGDMPAVGTGVLGALMAAFTGANAICVPVRHGRKGNPVLWGSAYFAEMMQLSGDSGAKPLMALHEAHVVEVEVATDSIFEDVDAPKDLARLNRSGATR